MSIKYTREPYKVPAKKGMRVFADGEPGIVTGAYGAYLRVRLLTGTCIERNKSKCYHPTWTMQYLTNED